MSQGGNLRRGSIALLTVFLLSGCASAARTYGPDGREAFAISCSGLARNWGMCYSKAGELCGTRGYDVVGQGGDSGVAVSAGQSGVVGGSVISRSLLVACK